MIFPLRSVFIAGYLTILFAASAAAFEPSHNYEPGPFVLPATGTV